MPVSLEVRGPVAVLTLDNPGKLNALSLEMLDGIGGHLDAVEGDEAVRAVVITGAGEKAFAAGADIGYMRQASVDEARSFADAGHALFRRIEAFPKPVIAAVNGFALGGGCELAMACTLRVASETARFGQPEVKLGVTPGFAGTQRLPRLVGKGRALDLLLTGRIVDAQEALAIGLVNRVVPAADLMAKSRDLALALAALAPAAMRSIIEAVNRGMEMAFPEAAFLEATLFGLCFSTADMREGTRAFLEKRPATFTGK